MKLHGCNEAEDARAAPAPPDILAPFSTAVPHLLSVLATNTTRNLSRLVSSLPHEQNGNKATMCLCRQYCLLIGSGSDGCVEL